MNIDQRVRVVIGDLVIQAQAQQQKIEEQAEQIAKLEDELSQAKAQVGMYKARPVIQGGVDSIEARVRKMGPLSSDSFEQKYQDDAMVQAMEKAPGGGVWWPGTSYDKAPYAAAAE